MPDSKLIKGSVTRKKLPDAAAASAAGLEPGKNELPVPTTIGCEKPGSHKDLPVPTRIGCGKPHKKSPPAKKSPAKRKSPAKKK